jgi:hypothetical protein
MGELLDVAAPILQELGVVGVLLLWIVIQSKRYDTLTTTAEARISEVNEKRVAEAQQAAKDAERYLDLAAQMMQHVASSAAAFQAAANTLDLTARRLEALAQRLERP